MNKALLEAELRGQLGRIVFRNWVLTIKEEEYRNGRIALSLCQNGDEIMMATVNCPEIPLEEGEVLIKDYSENDGILEAMLSAGVISDPVPVPYNFVTVWKCNYQVKRAPIF